MGEEISLEQLKNEFEEFKRAVKEFYGEFKELIKLNKVLTDAVLPIIKEYKKVEIDRFYKLFELVDRGTKLDN